MVLQVDERHAELLAVAPSPVLFRDQFEPHQRIAKPLGSVLPLAQHAIERLLRNNAFRNQNRRKRRLQQYSVGSCHYE